MLPQWFLITCYVGLGAAALLLLARFFIRRSSRSGKSAAGGADDNTLHESATPQGEAAHHAAPATTGNANPSAPPVSWENRRLFTEHSERTEAAKNPVPRLEPHEFPTADRSDYAFGGITPILAALLPDSDERREEIKRELRTAGFHKPHAWQNLAAFRYVAIMIPLMMFGILLLFVPPQGELPVALMLIVGCILGWSLPRLYIKNKAAERVSQIEHAMPDMLDMLNMCVSQGLTVPQSLKRVSHEFRTVYPALSRELQIVTEQAELGNLQQALENFSDRIDLPEVHSFTSLLIQTERMGTSVSEALEDYSDNMRESLRQQTDEKANKATFKLLFPTVLCLMPAVYMILLGPALIELSDFFGSGGGRDLIESSQQSLQTIAP